MDNNISNNVSFFSILAEQTSDIIICLNDAFRVTAYNSHAKHFYQGEIPLAANSDYFAVCNACGKEPAFSKRDIAKLSVENTLYSKTTFANKNYCLQWSTTQVFDLENQMTGYLIIAKKAVENGFVTENYANDAAFLNNLIGAIPSYLFLKDKNSVYMGSSAFHAKAAGFPKAADMLGKTDYDAIWKQEAAGFRQADMAVISMGEKKILEEMTTVLNNELTTVITHKTPIFDEYNDVIGVLGVAIDITDYITKVKEQEIVYLKSLVATLPDNIYWTDANGVYRGCNKQQAADFNVKSEDVIGKTIHDLADTLQIDKNTANIIYKNDQSVLKQKKVFVQEEDIILTNGQRRTYLSRKIPVIDNDGNCVGLIGISTNISALKEIEQKLRANHAQTELYLENILAHLPDNIYWINTDGVYKGCNDKQAHSLGLKKEDFLEKNIYELAELLHWDKNLADEIYKSNQQVMKGKVMITQEEEIIGADGKTKTHLCRKIPVLDAAGNCTGLLAISTDITFFKETEHKLRKAKEIAEAANLAKSEFLSSISHDVKTPLSGIVGLTNILRRTVPEEHLQIAQDVMEAGQHVIRFFENCIEMSKLEHNQLAVSEDSFSLKEVLHEISKLLSPSIKAKNLTLHINYSDKIPARLLGPRINIYRVILNLVGNAIKFTEQGSITIRVKLARNSTAEKPIATLLIMDTGIGIPTDKRHLIFERFSRVTPAHQGSYEGSGIGLYIVYKFITAMDGHIKVKSKLDKGSVFKVMLPLKAAQHSHKEISNIDFSLISPGNDLSAETQTDKTTSQRSVNQTTLTENTTALKPNILLVEDNVMAQKVAVTILKSLGCTVDIADCGGKAIALFYPGKYDLIFMDIGLPDMKGYEVAKHMRVMEQHNAKPTPILGVSAHAELEEKTLSLDAGIEQMFAKPLLFNQAKQLLSHYIFERHNHSTQPLAVNANNPPPLHFKNLKVVDLQQKTDGSNNSDRQYSLQMLHKLTESLPESLAEIDIAYKNKNMRVLQDAVHKLHGGLCYTKTPQLLQITSELESSLKNAEHEKLALLYEDFLKAITSFKQVYQVLTDIEDLIPAS